MPHHAQHVRATKCTRLLINFSRRRSWLISRRRNVRLVWSSMSPTLLLVWLRKTMYRSSPALYLFLGFSMSWLLTSSLVIGYSVL
jgi:hypothetical protein